MLCLSFNVPLRSLCRPLTPSLFSPALFWRLPLTEPLYFRQKQSLYFPSHCPALPQSETLIAGQREMRVKGVGMGRVQHAGQEQERLHNGLLSSLL